MTMVNQIMNRRRHGGVVALIWLCAMVAFVSGTTLAQNIEWYQDEDVVRVTVRIDHTNGQFIANVGREPIRTSNWIEIEKAALEAFPDRTVSFISNDRRFQRVLPRAMIGIVMEPIGGVASAQLRIPEGQAVVLTEVIEGMPADEAGLQEHDIVLKCDGTEPLSKQEFTNILNRAHPDDALNLMILREGSPMELRVSLRAYDPMLAHRNRRVNPLSAFRAASASDMLSEVVVRTDSELDQFMTTQNELAITALTGENGQPMQLQTFPSANSMLPSLERSAFVTIQNRNSELEAEIRRIRDHLERMEAMMEILMLERFPQGIIIQTEESEDSVETESDP